MKKTVRSMLVISGALVCLVGMSSRAEAGLITAICDDLQCTGGNDFLVLDNSVRTPSVRPEQSIFRPPRSGSACSLARANQSRS